jgi:hypothetical protein
MVGGKLEEKAFDVLRKNSEVIADVVKKFEELVVAYFSKEDMKRAEVLGRELSTLETKADRGRRDVIRLLQQGAFLPAFRGDMAWLAERLDRIADTAEGAMRAILLRKHLMKALKKAERKDERIKKWRSNLLKMAKLTTETINVLQSSVEALKTDTDLALRRAKDVDALEHQVDLIEEELIDDLYELERLLDPLSVVQLVDVIRRSGNISDRAEDMSDSIAILAMSFVA